MSDHTRLGVMTATMLFFFGIDNTPLFAQRGSDEESTRMREQRMGDGGGRGDGMMGRGGRGGGRGGGGRGGGDRGGRGGGPGGGMMGRGGPGGDMMGRGGPGGGMMGRGGPGGGMMGRGGPGGGPDQQSPYRSTITEIEPLVPGFGEDDVLTPAPGFGAEAELFTAEVTDDDRRNAEREFGYYDQNRDRKIDSDEMKRSRYGADLPLYDKNRDGVITLNEMEYRHARRRAENIGGNQGGSSSRGRSREEKESDDDDSDAWLWSERLGLEDRKSYRARSPAELSTEGFPDWFTNDDTNGDGQIAMAEWATSWTNSELASYSQFDLNQDGVITPQECIKAGQNGATRDGSISVASAADSSDAVSSTAPGSPAPSSDASATSVPAAHAASLPRIDPRSMDYFTKVVAKYDKSGDKQLTRDEWSNMSKDPGAADVDGNGRISVEEYARWSMK